MKPNLIFFKKPSKKKQASKVWTPELDRKLRKLWPTMFGKDVAVEMGMTLAAVQGRAKKLKLRKSADFKTIWTKEELDQFIGEYPDKFNTELAAMFGKNVKAIEAKAGALKLRKSPAFWARLAERPNAGRFKEGQKSWNAGKKINVRNDGTRFKKGNVPHNTKADKVVTLRFFHDRPELFIRVALGKWIRLAHYVFQEYYGEIPKGCVIRHKNENHLDCRLENLECLTKYENAIRNSGHVELTEGFVLKTLSRDRATRSAIQENLPELIELKRTSIKIKRALKNADE